MNAIILVIQLLADWNITPGHASLSRHRTVYVSVSAYQVNVSICRSRVVFVLKYFITCKFKRRLSMKLGM